MRAARHGLLTLRYFLRAYPVVIKFWPDTPLAEMRRKHAQLELAQAEERHRQMEAAVAARKEAPPTSLSLDEEMDR